MRAAFLRTLALSMRDPDAYFRSNRPERGVSPVDRLLADLGLAHRRGMQIYHHAVVTVNSVRLEELQTPH